MSALHLTVDLDGAFVRAAATLSHLPAASERAMARALRKLSVWLRRQALRAVSTSTRIPQRAFLQTMRFRVHVQREGGRPVGILIWVGTNPIPVHRLGAVRWTRRMAGARVGRRGYPGTWSWGLGSRTGRAVMQRIGSARLPIERVEEQIHPTVWASFQRLEHDASDRFERLLRQELRYALHQESAA